MRKAIQLATVGRTGGTGREETELFALFDDGTIWALGDAWSAQPKWRRIDGPAEDAAAADPPG